jgi:hypothetical protein
MARMRAWRRAQTCPGLLRVGIVQPFPPLRFDGQPLDLFLKLLFGNDAAA